MSQKDLIIHNELHVAETGEDVGIAEGAKMINAYYEETGEIISKFIGRNMLEKILSQPNCHGVSISYALNNKGEKTFILIGVDENGSKILECPVVDENGQLQKQTGIVANRMRPDRDRDFWEDILRRIGSFF